MFEEEGALVIVDYKTDGIAAEQALAQAAHHAPQLQLYGRGLAQALGMPVRERLVLFTSLGPGRGRVTVLHLVRHGQVDNPQKIVYGRQRGWRLSDRGRQEAEAVARHLGGRPHRPRLHEPARARRADGDGDRGHVWRRGGAARRSHRGPAVRALGRDCRGAR